MGAICIKILWGNVGEGKTKDWPDIAKAAAHLLGGRARIRIRKPREEMDELPLHH